MNQCLSITEISELVYTRISHDLIGNVGAVSNAVELLEEGDLEFLDDIKSILKASSTVLSARLKFFRIAFGMNNTSHEQLESIANITQEYLKTVGSQNYTIDLRMKVTNPELCKIAMVSAMILSDVLVKGGVVEIIEENGGIIAQEIGENTVSQERMEAIKSVIRGDVIKKIAQYAPVFYLKQLLNEISYKISIIDGAELKFTINKG